jgi:threonine dehydrogenase-like Zn-dependent dehydrogenase
MAMKALVWTAPYEAVMRSEEVPTAGPGQAVLAVRAAGVCGSDLHGYRGHSPLRVPPLILGHEVVARDDDGTLYVVNPLVGCGDCRLCSGGTPNLCPRRGLLGLDRPGAFAEYVAVARDNLLALPEGMSPLLGTLVEPLATPVHALRAAGPVEGAVVAVIGCGPIGLLACYAARRRGARFVAAYDLDESRIAHARALADACATSADGIRPAVAEASGGLGADIVVDAVGVEPAWNAALALVRPGGTVAEVGLGQADGSAPVGKLVRDGIAWRGIYAYTPDDFRSALAMLADEPPPLDWATTASLDDGPQLLAQLAGGDGPVKAVFEL